jgi:hypothetical protein
MNKVQKSLFYGVGNAARYSSDGEKMQDFL